MYTSRAFVPVTIKEFPSQLVSHILSVALGVVMLSLVAQIKIQLPWTPVPITGQTFGVMLLALLWGSRLSLITFSTYLFSGFLGAPIFTGGLSGLLIGPTFGYLVGMLIASWAVGKLSDKGWSESYGKAIGACYIGSVIVFSCGLIGLSVFVPAKGLVTAGLLPFLPGDFIKNLLAAGLVKQMNKKQI